MAEPSSSSAFSAHYIAIRTAEARGLNERLLQATRDEMPAIRRLLVPILFRAWHRDHEQGWQLLARIGDDMLGFAGRPHERAVEIFVELSLAIANNCRGDRPLLDRLAAIWKAQLERLFATPLAKILGQGRVVGLLARVFRKTLERQPTYQPFNYQELEITTARPVEFREMWRAARACFEQPESGLGAVAEILGRSDLPFDLHLMLLCERALVYHGVKVDPAGTFTLLNRLFRDGSPWFRQSVLYVLFHQLGNLTAVEDVWLDRYAAMTREFFISDSWSMRTTVAEYKFGSHLAWPELVIDRWAPGTGPRIMPSLLEAAVKSGDAERIAGIFSAIDIVAFSHGRALLALKILDRSLAIGGAALEERVLASLATVRLQDQPLVDAFIDEHRELARLRPRLETAEPNVRAEDMPTLLDGLTVQLILSSDYFRGQVCAAFQRAAEAKSAPQLLGQLINWLRVELRQLGP
jgi:hypothetical protein